MWVFFIPFIIISFLVLVAIAYFFARRDVRRGPNPEDIPGPRE